jgi:hypothetical protein
LEVHVGHDVHTRPKLAIPVLARFENDLYGNPLHNSYVVAGGILRGMQAEERARCPRYAVHVTLESPAGRVHMNLGLLSDPHVLELRLLEVGRDPNFIERHNSNELLPRLNVQPDNDGFIHFTSDRSEGFRVLEVQLGLFEQCAPLLNVSDRRTRASPCRRHLLRSGLRRLVVRHGLHQTAPRLLRELLRCGLIGARRRHPRGTGSGCGQRLIVNLLGHFPFVDQKLVAVQIVLRWLPPVLVGRGRQ